MWKRRAARGSVIWLLDTNMLVYARNGVAPVVARLDEVWEQGEVVTSLLVVGELIYGVEKSIRREGNLAALEQQLAMLDGILPLTEAIVRRFGRLKAEMGRRGIIRPREHPGLGLDRPIPLAPPATFGPWA